MVEAEAEGTPPWIARTSGSCGSRAGACSCRGVVSGVGFDRLGSSPALMAFAMRRAWNLANLILAAISGSSGGQIWRSSRKV